MDRGGNYGWNVKEGTRCFDAAAVPPYADRTSCPGMVTSGIRTGDPLIDPVIEYPNAKQPGGGLGRTVVGGYVYRGTDLQRLRELYVFGDYTLNFGSTGNGSVFAATPAGHGLWQIEQMVFADRPDGRLGHYVKGSGQDARGEIYIMASTTTSPFGRAGKVFKLGRHKVRGAGDKS